MIGLLHIALPAFERWIVATFNEALPMVKDPKLAEDMRGFMGQESIHADTHEQASTISWWPMALSPRRCWARSTTSSPAR